MSRRARARIGTSGYQYDDWRKVLYHDTPKRRWFETYAEHFDTVEINNTFYNLPKPETLDDWRSRAPKGFTYALKLSRYATHIKRLKDPDEPIERFLSLAERLKSRLGPVLVQLPPNWNADPDRLDAFLDAAPARHRWAVEFRDDSWYTDEIFDVLRRHDAALVIHDMHDNAPTPEVLTASWTYLRYHGPAQARYRGRYSHQKLAAEARRIARWLDDALDVYAYFNNDVAGHAVGNAADLRRYVENAA